MDWFTLFFIFLVCFASKQFVNHNTKDKTTASVFSDSKYSYFTFIHTYSLRYFDIVDDEKAIKASAPFIGNPKENNYSISKAILKNPKQFLSNCFYSMKELLDYFGHPLFMPFFLYFFIGGLFLKLSSKEIYGMYIILFLLLLHIIPLIIFHVSVKYMTQLSSLIVILTSLGATKLNISKPVLYTAIGLICVIFLMYLTNNMFMKSLCV